MQLYTTYDVSLVLEEEPRLLTFLEKIRNRLYVDYYLKKKSGGKREINTYLYKANSEQQAELGMDILQPNKLLEASAKLKEVHTKINNSIFKQFTYPDCVHGFIPNHSILTAAKQHVGKRWVIAFDIHDFFGQTKSDYVLESLVNNFGFGSEAAWLIARLVSYKGRLPQGAVTSPMASNVAFYSADLKIKDFCDKYGIVYTRYADDLTFSFDKDELKDKLLEVIPTIIEESGYNINRKKTKIYGPEQIHYVLGYVVNSKVNVYKEKRRRLEAAIFNFIVKKEVPYGVDDYVKYKRSLLGKASFVLKANPDLGRLKRLYYKLKSFDPNQHVFTSKYFETVI